jgi:tetratricopeptide (TPR) repeat protein
LRPVIRHVVEQYLDCCDLRCGFARLWCASCRKDLLLPNGCKRRCFCCSCHQKRALAIREKLAPDSAKAATTLNSLGAIAYNRGDHAAARRLWERPLAIREKALGTDHPQIAESLNNLAITHTWTNDPAVARPLLQRAVRIQEKVLGPKHPNLAAGLLNLGDVIVAMGDMRHNLTEWFPIRSCGEDRYAGIKS